MSAEQSKATTRFLKGQAFYKALERAGTMQKADYNKAVALLQKRLSVNESLLCLLY